jgi:hypothetical protein
MRKVKATRGVKEPVVAKDAAGDEEAADSRDDQIMVRPDGYYWQTPDGKQEFGPFESLESALADREAADEQAPEPGETLQEAEGEIGIADWIDPETGQPAEGQSRPRFEEE